MNFQLSHLSFITNIAIQVILLSLFPTGLILLIIPRRQSIVRRFISLILIISSIPAYLAWKRLWLFQYQPIVKASAVSLISILLFYISTHKKWLSETVVFWLLSISFLIIFPLISLGSLYIAEMYTRYDALFPPPSALLLSPYLWITSIYGIVCFSILLFLKRISSLRSLFGVNIVAGIVIVSAVAFWTYTIQLPILPGSGYKNGKRAAREDIRRGNYKILVYGFPAGWVPNLKKILEEEFDVEVDNSVGCVGPKEYFDYADGYNEISRPAIDKKFGKGFLEQIETRAKEEDS